MRISAYICVYLQYACVCLYLSVLCLRPSSCSQIVSYLVILFAFFSPFSFPPSLSPPSFVPLLIPYLSQLLSGGWDGVLKQWNITESDISHSGAQDLSEHSTGVLTVELSRFDDNMAVSGAEDGNVIVWDLDMGQSAVVIGAHHGPVQAARFVSRDMLVTSSHDG